MFITSRINDGKEAANSARLLPDVGSKVQDRQKHVNCSKERQFNVGSSVYARNYSQGPLWLPWY